MTRPRWESRSEFAPIRFALQADCNAHIKGDPVELREVLVNMIYNAIDAMPSGGEVRVSTQENRDRVVISHHRHRHRHGTRSKATPLRSLLHDERQGRHRHGPGGQLRYHPPPRGFDRGR